MRVAVLLPRPLAHQSLNPNHTTHATRERTMLYQTLAEHFETWRELASAGHSYGETSMRH